MLSQQQNIGLLFLVVVPIILLWRRISRKKENDLKLPPGPWKLPIIGNLHQIGSMPHDSLWKLSLKYGPLMSLKLGSVPTVVISSDDMAREVFKNHDTAFSNRPHMYAIRKLSYGTDLAIAPYGENWRRLRKVSMMEVFSTKRVESFTAEREAEVESLVAYMRSTSSSSPPTVIDFHRTMVALTNNFICRIMFGERYTGRLNKYEEGGSRFHDVFEEALMALGGFSLADYFPSVKWMDKFTGFEKKVQNVFDKFDCFYDEMIQEHIDSAADPGHEDLVHVLLRLQKDPNYSTSFRTMNNIKGLITDFFLAGSDTASTTLVWAMTNIIRNPRVKKKVEEELRNVVGNKNKVEEKDLEHVSYLKLVIKETFRSSSPLPLLIPRETTETCRIEGWEIPAGTRVIINAKAISRDPRCWTNPDEFWPERFLENARGYKPGPHYDFIPFGGGRRICPGANLALSMIELALANLLHCFDWELPNGMSPEELDIEECFGLSVRKKNPLCVVAKPK